MVYNIIFFSDVALAAACDGPPTALARLAFVSFCFRGGAMIRSFDDHSTQATTQQRVRCYQYKEEEEDGK